MNATQLMRESIHTRAREIALKLHSGSPQVNQTDYEQAKLELTGESDPDRQQAVIVGSLPADPRYIILRPVSLENTCEAAKSSIHHEAKRLFHAGLEDIEHFRSIPA